MIPAGDGSVTGECMLEQKDHDDAPICRVAIPKTLLHNWHTCRHASLTRKTYMEELNTALETVLSGAVKIKNDALKP